MCHVFGFSLNIPNFFYKCVWSKTFCPLQIKMYNEVEFAQLATAFRYTEQFVRYVYSV